MCQSFYFNPLIYILNIEISIFFWIFTRKISYPPLLLNNHQMNPLQAIIQLVRLGVEVPTEAQFFDALQASILDLTPADQFELFLHILLQLLSLNNQLAIFVSMIWSTIHNNNLWEI